ncbi:MAG TPA: FHA domain-containing protein [Bdellovibrionota bacterium]|nr:FHA domain-containing protein [Bdellovibrionota bacterium]
MKASLKIVAGGADRKIIPLKRGKYGIGRAEGMAIQIDSRQVSRQHAEIVVEENCIRLVDLGSANGTVLNGVPVENEKLRNGDRISIGEVVIEFESDIPDETKRSPVTRFPQKKTLRSVARPAEARPSRNPRSVRFVVTGALMLLSASISIFGSLAFRSVMIDRLEAASLERAQSLIRYMAEKNREDLRLGNELLLDADSILQEKGVREAEIVGTKGRILAPISKLHQVTNDLFVKEALAQKSDRPILPSPRLGDGTYVLVHPIRAYDDAHGVYETLGVAKILFSPEDAVGSVSAMNRLIFVILGLAVGLSLLLGWLLSKPLTQPLVRLAERIHLHRAGHAASDDNSGADQVPFSDWAPLVDAVDRLTEDREE